MKHRLAIAFLFLAILSFPALSQSAGREVENKLKAEMLERFTLFIEWPSIPEPFQLCVLGEHSFDKELDKVFKETLVNKHKVVIRYLNSRESIGSCQMLYIAKTDQAELTQILASLKGKPVLTISDTEGFAEQGVMINFYDAGEFVRFEINQEAADASGLKFSSRLLKLAKIVETKKE